MNKNNKRPSPNPSLPGRGVVTFLMRMLRMLAWWNTKKKKEAPTPDPSPASLGRDRREQRWRGVMNTDRVDRMDLVLNSTANKDRMDPTTTDTRKTSPPREGVGEAAQEMSGEAATLIAQPVSVISGPVSSTQLSRFQLLSSLRSESKALARTSDPSPALPREGAGKYVSGGAGRKINYLVLHCSDTRPDQDFTIEKLKACHKTRGFGDYPGYHVYVRRDGSVYYCRPVRLKGCHVKGHNSDSIGVCYEGGRQGRSPYPRPLPRAVEGSGNLIGSQCERPSTAAQKGALVGSGPLAYTPVPYGRGGKYEDNRTVAQKEALRQVFAVLHDCFPDARIVGHNEFGVPKACPCLSKESMEEFRQEIIHWRE